MKIVTIIKTAFLMIGILFLGLAGYIGFSTYRFIDQAITAKGQVIDYVQTMSNNSPLYAPVVAFRSLSGEIVEFVSSSSSNPPAYSLDEGVDILYLPNRLESAKIKSFFSLWGGSLILGSFGLVFFLSGGGIVLFGFLKSRKGAYLKEHGVVVESVFKGVEINEGLNVNGSYPFRIITQWLNPATNELHIFRSNNLWFDPSDYIKQPEINVYMDKINPKKYWVDTSFLPEVAEG